MREEALIQYAPSKLIGNRRYNSVNSEEVPNQRRKTFSKKKAESTNNKVRIPSAKPQFSEKRDHNKPSSNHDNGRLLSNQAEHTYCQYSEAVYGTPI